MIDFLGFRTAKERRARLALAAQAFALLPEHVQYVLRSVPIVIKEAPEDDDRALGVTDATVSAVFIEDTSHDADREDEDDTTTPYKRGQLRIYLANISPRTPEGVAGVMLHETAHVAGLDDEQAHVLGL